jgi:hypothetical protein
LGGTAISVAGSAGVSALCAADAPGCCVEPKPKLNISGKLCDEELVNSYLKRAEDPTKDPFKLLRLMSVCGNYKTFDQFLFEVRFPYSGGDCSKCMVSAQGKLGDDVNQQMIQAINKSLQAQADAAGKQDPQRVAKAGDTFNDVPWPRRCCKKSKEISTIDAPGEFDKFVAGAAGSIIFTVCCESQDAAGCAYAKCCIVLKYTYKKSDSKVEAQECYCVKKNNDKTTYDKAECK